MMMAITAAKIGRSMKKRDIRYFPVILAGAGALLPDAFDVAGVPPVTAAAVAAAGAPPPTAASAGAVAGLASVGVTGAPGRTLSRLSMITWSPALTPESTVQSLPTQSPTLIGRI